MNSSACSCLIGTLRIVRNFPNTKVQSDSLSQEIGALSETLDFSERLASVILLCFLQWLVKTDDIFGEINFLNDFSLVFFFDKFA